MIETFAAVFEPAERVLAVPPFGAPKLMLAESSGILRWRMSAALPGTRRSAKAIRFLLRVGAAAGIGAVDVTKQGAADNEFSSLLAAAGLERGPIALRAGTGGLHRKLVIAVHDRAGSPVAYVKVGQDADAAMLVAREAEIVGALPPDVGPSVLAVGTLLGARAAVYSALNGTPPSASPLPPREAIELLARTSGSRLESAATHPWVVSLMERHPLEVSQFVEALARECLPIGVSHGDFAPWNLVHTSAGMRAYDWEWGATEGLPFVDAAHYSLQVQRLIKRAHPRGAGERSSRLMAACLGLGEREAWGLIGLTGVAMLERASSEADAGATAWWRGVVERALRSAGGAR